MKYQRKPLLCECVVVLVVSQVGVFSVKLLHYWKTLRKVLQLGIIPVASSAARVAFQLA